MSLSKTDLEADLADIMADVPATLVWGAQSLSGTAGARGREDEATEEDLFQRGDLEWCGKLSDFTNSLPPGPGDSVSVGGVMYRVDRYEISPEDVCVRLVLKRD